jgi:hypothetical protein
MRGIAVTARRPALGLNAEQHQVLCEVHYLGSTMKVCVYIANRNSDDISV